jgi:thiol-disulfide isomerase/thioredoxin
MLKRPMLIVLLLLWPGFLGAQESKLDDATLQEQAQKIARRIALKLSENQRDLALYKPQLDKLDGLIGQADNPAGAGVRSIRLYKASVLLELKQGEKGLAELAKVEAMRPKPKVLESIYQQRARYYIRKRDVKALGALLEKAKKVLDDKTIELLKGSYYLLKARNLSRHDKHDELQRLIKDAEAERVDHKMVSLMRREIARCAFALGKTFPDFQVKDIEGKGLSVADYKGKVVLVDFWATWCAPCRSELPMLMDLYKKYQPKGFEIIGISLDEKEKTFKGFIKRAKMPWRHYYDGKGWRNKLARKYLVDALPATFLLDGEGKILAKDIRVDTLEAALKKALGIKQN